MGYNFKQYSILFVSAMTSLLAGATVVHTILRPNTEIRFNQIKLNNDNKLNNENKK